MCYYSDKRVQIHWKPENVSSQKWTFVKCEQQGVTAESVTMSNTVLGGFNRVVLNEWFHTGPQRTDWNKNPRRSGLHASHTHSHVVPLPTSKLIWRNAIAARNHITTVDVPAGSR